jgi:hypothetical protein
LHFFPEGNFTVAKIKIHCGLILKLGDARRL